MTSQRCAVCQCTFGDSDCFHFTGAGTREDPYIAHPSLDEAEGQLAECGPSGLGVFLPPIYSDPPAVQVYATVDQTIPYNAAQVVFFNQERYDTDSMHDTEENFSRITFNTEGVYLVTFNVMWKKITVDTGDEAAFIRRNGAEFLALDSMPIADPDLFGGHSLSVEDEFQAGDYAEALVKQDAVLDDVKLFNSILSERHSPVFSAIYLRPLVTT